MRTLTASKELKEALAGLRKKGKSIGFVPTMGALHEGHLSLVKLSRRENKVTVASVFVNPLQFGPKEDFRRYPRNLVRDKELLVREKTDILFAPSPKTFYAPQFQTSVSVANLSRPLCGAARPTHFAGVCTVVLKLLNLVRPDRLYLGQKDYQQCRVVGQMMGDLDIPAELRMAPTVREKDGLAMSSRNIFLSPVERREAPVVHHALQKGAELARSGVRDATRLKKAIKEVLGSAPHAKIDYLEIVDAATLQPVVRLKTEQQTLLAAAVFFGRTRLIDNIRVKA